MTVYLVGAGPGDPGLLTVRGAELLSRAEVVVHDRLSAASLLDLAPADAERIDVGKTPRGPSVPQEHINSLLVERGLEGGTVVRLKGGDPFVFARGAEEAPALAPAGGVRYHEPEAMEAETSPLKPARILRMLQDRMPDETLFASDIGEHTIFALHYLRIDRPDSFIVNTGLGSMGSGIGSAIGAKIAAPRRPVVAICGDFGFQMNGMEIATCVQDRVGVVFAVFNDARMRMVEGGLQRIFGRAGQMDGPRVDFAALARSVGARGYTIRCEADLEAIPQEHLTGDVPCVLDFEVDPRSAFPVNGRVAQIKNFSSQ